MSQFRESEILAEMLGCKVGTFCEFGAGDGVTYCNTLELARLGWQGVYIEPDLEKYKLLEENHPNQRTINGMITADNVNDLVPKVDVLSIDIDGNDYHVWEAYKHTPEIVIIESNPQRYDYVMEYDPDFKLGMPKHNAYGASPDKLKELGEEKGYHFTCNTGVNLIFSTNHHNIESDYFTPNYAIPAA